MNKVSYTFYLSLTNDFLIFISSKISNLKNKKSIINKLILIFKKIINNKIIV